MTLRKRLALPTVSKSSHKFPAVIDELFADAMGAPT
jgi:hypothetical protein